MLIDIHTHLVPDPAPDGCHLTLEDLLQRMDASGIDKAVVLPLESPEAFTIPVPTWEVIHLCQREPERLIPFCVVDPRTLSFSGAKLEAHLLPYLE